MTDILEPLETNAPSRNLAILMCAPATSYVLDEFHSSSKLQATLLVSIWELGEVIGPLVIAPLSESFGRLPAYHSANIFFILCTVAAAESTSMGMLIAMRFLLGFSVASTVINPCIVGDMFPEEHRGKAMSLMGMIPFVAPCLGPTIGGFVAEARGWRWYVCPGADGEGVSFLELLKTTHEKHCT